MEYLVTVGKTIITRIRVESPCQALAEEEALRQACMLDDSLWDCTDDGITILETEEES